MVADDRKYTKSHEWVMIDGDVATVGVTEYAAAELGDVVFLDLPEPGVEISRGEPVGTIETVKAVEDLYTPVTGEVLDVNQAVVDGPELVNNDPLDAGWLIKVRLGEPEEVDALLTAAEYDALLGG
jgi:glycine cleavage system H protein